ncbi:TIGR03084 family metal-binding protein [Cumulibacter manganitolerans]|uniref:TIGR03084 family metal-binding protein n=1 Tax=Cumulibacter manganitolerans TaxID=1884992 RepID=UPI0012980303|nr:TIGR03084 family metal-binding protein [Cumulibacter manganitolerans]
MADIEALIADLRAEQEGVDAVLAQITDDQWATDTPAEGWAVRDQVAHLAYFDGAVTQAITDPEAFRATLPGRAEDPDFVNTVAKALVALPPAELWARWKSGREPMYAAMRDADPKARYPWYGPPMSVASACTARIMETWAHGQDIADGLGITREPTDRVAHVVFIGYKARPFAYANRGLDLPDGDVRLEVTLPSGDPFVIGRSDTDVIRGTAYDMALLVTQRRHRADTSLVAEGPLAEEFLDVAQAFAGPPGGGREPGQFPRA